MNNPLIYSDPSGESWWILAAAIMAGKVYHDGVQANGGNTNPLSWNWSNAHYVVGWSTGGGGNTIYGGIGWNGNNIPIIGCNENSGTGLGMYSNGSANINYFSVDYDAAAKSVDKNSAINQVGDAQSQGGGGLTTKEWGTGDYLGSGSILTGAAGYRLGSHMNGLSRFRPITTLRGSIVFPATSGYKFGPLSGSTATRLGAGLRIGGNLLGGFGLAYSGYQFIKTPSVKGGFDIGFGVVGFLGPIGLGVSAIYFVGDTFIPGGWQAVPQHQMNEIKMNTSNGVWWGAHNHFK